MFSEMKKRTKQLNIDYMFIGIVLLSTVFIGIKALNVHLNSMADECSQIVNAYRFYLGAAPVVDDWTPEQFHSLVDLPFLQLFLFFNKGSLVGVVPFFRIVYLLLKLIILLYGYVKFKKMDRREWYYAGLLAWYLCTPFNIESFTYQTAPMMMLVYILIVIYTDSSICEYGLAGAAYAISILSQPTWVASYFVVFVYAVVIFIKQRELRKYIIALHIGIGTIFIAFCIFVFSRAGIHDFIWNLQWVLDDTDHSYTLTSISGIWQMLYDDVFLMLKILYYENHLFGKLNLVYIGCIVLFWRKRDMLKPLMWFLLSASMMMILVEGRPHIANQILGTVLWLAIEQMFYVRDKKSRYCLFLMVLYTMLTSLGTNTGIYSMTAYSCPVLLVCFWNYEEKMQFITPAGIRMTLSAIETISIVVVFIVLLTVRLRYDWTNEVVGLEWYKYKIEDGPMAGLRSNQAIYDAYYIVWNDIETMNLRADDILLCGRNTPLAYLDSGCRIGAHQMTFFWMDYARLGWFQYLHPEMFPTGVYYEEWDEDDEASSFYEKLLEQGYEIWFVDGRMMAETPR